MKQIKIAFAAFAIAAISLFSYGQTAIDVLINDADFKGETIKQLNATIAKANTALQPSSVTATNVIVSGDDKTNTIIVINGLITSWTV